MTDAFYHFFIFSGTYRMCVDLEEEKLERDFPPGMQRLMSNPPRGKALGMDKKKNGPVN